MVTTTGGTGDLNLTWKTGTVDTTPSIIWTWEPMSGVTYEWKVLTEYSDAANPCAGDTFFNDVPDANKGAQFEASAAAGAGEIRGLCLRTDDKDNRALSFAWGVGTPAGATAGPTADATLKDGVVTTASDLGNPRAQGRLRIRDSRRRRPAARQRHRCHDGRQGHPGGVRGRRLRGSGRYGRRLHAG